LFAPSRPHFPKWRVAAVERSLVSCRAFVAASVVLASLAGLLVAWPLWERRVDSSVPLPTLWLAGQLLPPGPEGDAKALEVFRRYAKSPIVIELPRGGPPDKRLVSRAALGLEIDNR